MAANYQDCAAAPTAGTPAGRKNPIVSPACGPGKAPNGIVPAGHG
jgi:hypothetical protein